MFKGLCHLRNAQRMFKFSRVQSAVDLETGEVARDLENFLRLKYGASPYAALTMVFDIPSFAAYRQIVGRISKQEKDLIEMTLRAAEDVSGTNQNSKPAELEAIEYMRKRFGIS